LSLDNESQPRDSDGHVRRAPFVELLEVDGPAGALETLVEAPAHPPLAVALVCHPHPLQQGTMNNKVVFTLARSFVRLGAVGVRFNFRGVGRSLGVHSGEGGEVEDALAVARWISARWGGLPLYLAGFSFGAAVALEVATAIAPGGVVSVAPAIARLGNSFVPPDCPWLVIQGSADDVVPPDAVSRWLAPLERRPTIVVLEGAGHFFHGRLGDIEAAVTRYFEPLMISAGEHAQGAE
jgi:alpha/beta superfamily hydrolase